MESKASAFSSDNDTLQREMLENELTSLHTIFQPCLAFLGQLAMVGETQGPGLRHVHLKVATGREQMASLLCMEKGRTCLQLAVL